MPVDTRLPTRFKRYYFEFKKDTQDVALAISCRAENSDVPRSKVSGVVFAHYLMSSVTTSVPLVERPYIAADLYVILLISRLAILMDHCFREDLKKDDLVKLVKQQRSKWPEKSFNASRARVLQLKDALLRCGFTTTVPISRSGNVESSPAACASTGTSYPRSTNIGTVTETTPFSTSNDITAERSVDFPPDGEVSCEVSSFVDLGSTTHLYLAISHHRIEPPSIQRQVKLLIHDSRLPKESSQSSQLVTLTVMKSVELSADWYADAGQLLKALQSSCSAVEGGFTSPL